ncbi:unnamed protein product [Clonostachys byssicola]|uniref:(2E,6E)-farnesyl diphosphate synthase n=1 Tax=Clonostachys byssicola TaxID=160290 RepID=A0A9N9UTA8_9HYPO|nr:unnamed protein product [Clonostachys byssicola]
MAFASPSAIPPRRSSTGHSHSNSLSTPRQLLKAVDEANWLGQKQQTTSPNTHQQETTPSLQHPLPSSSLDPGRSQAPSSNMLENLPLSSTPNTNILEKQHLSSLVATAPYAPPPPPDPNRYRNEDLDFGPARSWTAEKEAVVRAPYDYTISHPGKDFRAQLIGAFNIWLQVPQKSLDIITKVVGMLHESSLLVDDVQDMSELRRGFPVAHNIFGVAQTINSANYIYFSALVELQKLGNPKAVDIFAEELVNLHRGQGMDLYWRDTLTCPTEDDYLEMVGNKTGGLFRLGIKLMQAESDVNMDCVPLANLVGLIFQIRDDYMNLNSQEYSDNKGMCEDLTEGKFSFPIIHSIRTNPVNRQLVNILKQKTTNIDIKKYAVTYMESTGSFQYTRDVLAILLERAEKTAVAIDDGREKLHGVRKILAKMAVPNPTSS